MDVSRRTGTDHPDYIAYNWRGIRIEAAIERERERERAISSTGIRKEGEGII